MAYLTLKFLHIGAMFLATALAVGSISVLVLVLRSGDPGAIRGAFRHAEALSRIGGICYGLGVVFGVVTALNGGIDLMARWLLTAYALLGLLIAVNLYADHWMKQVARAANETDGAATPELARWVRPAVVSYGGGGDHPRDRVRHGHEARSVRVTPLWGSSRTGLGQSAPSFARRTSSSSATRSRSPRALSAS